MKTRRTGEASRLMLRGPSVQYGDGRIVTPPPFDLDDILVAYTGLSEDQRRKFLAIFSHSLTVDMRVALHDRPISDTDADRARRINEWLHQLTSCFDPQSTRDAAGEAELIRDIAAGSFQLRLDRGVGRAIAAAAGNTIALSKKLAAALG
jgi:hypothetical protein